ncbi:MAG: PIN domain-containing protein [Panacagrimonas sp.]
MKQFFDTNILIYALDTTEGERHRIASELVRDSLKEQRLVVSTQVLQEFRYLARGRLRGRLMVEAVELMFEEFARYCGTGTDLPLLRAAIRRADADTLNLYDAIVLEGALRTGCTELLSEDLQHGRVFGRLTVRNPFL